MTRIKRGAGTLAGRARQARALRVLAPAALAALAALAQIGCAGDDPAARLWRAAPTAWTLVDTTVVDVERGALLPHRDVSVRDGIVAAISSSAAEAAAALAAPGADAEAGAGASRRIDGRGLYVMPGLIDAHVHLYAAADLAEYVRHGVTAVQNMWGLEGWITRLGFPRTLDLTRAVEEGTIGPAIVTAGPVLEGEPATMPLMGVFADADAARAEVARQARTGYDFVKTYDALPREAFLAALEAAADHALPVRGHVPRAVSLIEAIEGGMAQIEHLTGLLDVDAAVARLSADERAEAFAAMRRHGTVVCPTLVVYRRVVPAARAGTFAALPGRERLGWRERALERLGARSMRGNVKIDLDAYPGRIRAAQEEAVRALDAAGVAIVAGTDTGNPYVYPGHALHEELALLHAAGLSLPGTLRAATSEAARAIGLAGRGAVRAGAVADLLILERDPLAALANLRAIRAVSLRGRWLARESLERAAGARADPALSD